MSNIFLHYMDIKHALKQFLDDFIAINKSVHIVPIPKASNFWDSVLEKYNDPDGKTILLFDVIYDTGKTMQKYKRLFPEASVLTILTKHPSPDRYHLFAIPKSLHNKWFYGCGLDLIKYDNIRMLSDLPYIAYVDPKDDSFFVNLSKESGIPIHTLIDKVKQELANHTLKH